MTRRSYRKKIRVRGDKKRARERKRLGFDKQMCPVCKHPLHVGGFCGIRLSIPGDVTFACSGETCGCKPENCPARTVFPKEES